MNDLSDEEILINIRSFDRNRNDKAFLAIYKLCQDMVYSYILRNSGNEVEAEDIFQDGIIILYNQVKGKDIELTSKLSTYVFSICRNLWLKRLRKLKRHVTIEAEDVENISIDGSILETIEESEQSSEVARLLNQLNEGCRKIILMYYYEKMKMNEISEILKFSSPQVAKNKKSGCMKKLRELAETSLFFNQNNNK